MRQWWIWLRYLAGGEGATLVDRHKGKRWRGQREGGGGMREEEAEAEAIAGALEGGRHGIPAGATPDVEREGRRRFVRHRVGTPEEPRERMGRGMRVHFFSFF